jgi:hypothetical protein
MNIAHRKCFMLCSVLVLSLFLSRTSAKGAKNPAEAKLHHPSHIQHALHELKEARHDLHGSKHDFGGHKAAALTAIDDAIRHLERIVAHEHHNHHVAHHKPHANDHHKHHSHLHHALHELKEARHELRHSWFDFGGLKEVALRDTEIAIRQLELVVKHHKK